MELSSRGFGFDELTALRLRKLFERRGFKRARVNKFEDYALYVDNKNFLQSESVITFMDVNGRLMALKPDVTLSVVRGAPKKELPTLEKLYYVDEVYRLSKEDREYKVRSQIGVEIIGREDGFSNIETVDLALSCLETIGNSFVLNVSHLGFVSGMLEGMELTHSARQQAMAGIHSKSPHDLAAALESAGAGETDKNRALALCEIHGDFESTLKQARGLIFCEAMQRAYSELEVLGRAIVGGWPQGRIKLDFSVVNDLDYYNGLIFLGYVEGIPKVVLTGGRYDNLMRRMGKKNGAVGFAVSLGDLSLYHRGLQQRDFDVLVTYPADCDYALLLAAVKSLTKNGACVRLESEDSKLMSAGFTWEKHCRFENGALREVESC